MSIITVKRSLALLVTAALAGCGTPVDKTSNAVAPGAPPGVAEDQLAELGVPAPEPVPVPTGAVGQPVRYVGRTTDPVTGQDAAYEVEMTVTETTCDVGKISAEYLDPVTPALGQFCVVRYDVRNVGAVPVTLDASMSSLVDSRGRAYTVHSDGSWTLESAEERYSSEAINPTATVARSLVFDVPADAVPALFHVRDLWQTGVDITLS